MQTFLRNGNTCEELTAEALRVGNQGKTRLNYSLPLQVHEEILRKLGKVPYYWVDITSDPDSQTMRGFKPAAWTPR